MEDLKGVYSVSRNPHYMSGELSEEDILKRFLRNFEGETTVDGKQTKDVSSQNVSQVRGGSEVLLAFGVRLNADEQEIKMLQWA
ncbi:hypothetical protein Avbf_10852 [Armadillidium vulgare]|nr:hypothetical protein Avbf_10852 [Armadillidium vulgare]